METIFVTRIRSEKEFGPVLEKLIKEVHASKIQYKYIISDFEDPGYKVCSIPVKVIKDDNPTSPVSLNTFLKRIKEDGLAPDAFLVSSQEVELTRGDIEKLTKKLGSRQDLLVVGYKLKIKGNNYYVKSLMPITPISL